MNSVVFNDVSMITSAYADALRGALRKTFFVTGAGGMVGGYVIHTLMELARSNPAMAPAVIANVRDIAHARIWLGQYENQPNFQFHESNVEDIDISTIGPVDYIVHAACPASPAAFREHPLAVISANVHGTLRLLCLARLYGARLCLISSMEVYGDQGKPVSGHPLAEHEFAGNDPLDVRSVYPESKRMAENLCACDRAEYGTHFVVVRLGHTYGPGMKLTDTRVQMQFIRSALAGEGITMLSNGLKQRSSTYIADACAATMLAMLQGNDAAAYNVSNNDSITSIRQLAETILEQTGANSGELEVKVAENKDNMWTRVDTPIMLDCSAIRKLGWRPTVRLSDGIMRTLQYYRTITQTPSTYATPAPGA